MKRFSSIFSSSLGNILEWYDFGLFTIFSALFSRLFFPNENAYIALLATFSIFAIGFICRPIGALIFGYLGDKFGRAQTLRLSVLMISLPTLLVGLIPSYQEIGIAAPILLTLIRMWQGISVGGEYSGNLIYLAETAPQRHRALLTALAGTGANIGILLATVVGIISTSIFTNQQLQVWGWRIPYLISGLFSIIIYLTRLRMQETDVFIYLKKHHLLAPNPIKTAFTKNLPYLLRTLGMVCMGSTFYYFCFVYLPVLLSQRLYFSIHRVSILITLFISMMIILVPLAGWVCDRIGRRKMLLANALLLMILIVPGYYLLQFKSFMILNFILLAFTLISSSEQATTSIAVVENFPAPARYTGLSLGYNIGNGFLGGTIPLVCEWLGTTTHWSLAPAFYIAFCAMITVLVVFFFVPETRHKKLTI